MVKAVVGANWGDEGKGKITDMLAREADIIVRFQGGANAGHTIVNDYGKFALHTLPSGVFYGHTTSIIGNGVALDVPRLFAEVQSIVEKGVPMPKILVSDRAQMVMSYHKNFDAYEEERLGGKSFGSTKSGIAPFYSDKYAKIGFQVSELFDDELLKEKVVRVAEQKNVLLEHLYHKPLINPDELYNELMEYKKMVEPLYPFGHGLSYSHFEISNERAIADSVPVELVYPDGKVDNKKMPVLTDSLRIAVDVINQGPEEFSEGMEVVQLYISDPYATISKPVKELKAFKKIRLAYGEREKVTFTLTKEDFASFDSDLHQWVAEEGVYNILIGNSSRNIVCSMPVYLDAKTEYSYSLQTPIKVLYENSVTKAHMNHLWFRLGLDPADIDNKYEYEPHTRLINLVHLKCENPEQEALDEFELRVGSLKRA